jgi:hypothetical protein
LAAGAAPAHADRQIRTQRSAQIMPTQMCSPYMLAQMHCRYNLGQRPVVASSYHQLSIASLLVNPARPHILLGG